MDYIIIILIFGFIFIMFGLNPFMSKHKNKRMLKIFNKFNNMDADQAVAIGPKHFYSISNTTISKCNKINGKMIARWINTYDQKLHHITHLNSGVIVGKYLYCVNNPPSSKHGKKKHGKVKGEIYTFEFIDDIKKNGGNNTIEIFDCKNLEHINTIQVKCKGVLKYGSLTWIDCCKSDWWGCFSFYGKMNKHTTLVNFKIDETNNEINILDKWKFPEQVLKIFYPYSCSGCSISNSFLFCTTQNRKQIYVLTIDKSNNCLKYVDMKDSYFTGQGIGWDRYSKKKILWGIDNSVFGSYIVSTYYL